MRVNLSEEKSWLYGGGSMTFANSTGMAKQGGRRSSAIIGGWGPRRRPEAANHRPRPINGLWRLELPRIGIWIGWPPGQLRARERSRGGAFDGSCNLVPL
jgi:hypothetical protein